MSEEIKDTLPTTETVAEQIEEVAAGAEIEAKLNETTKETASEAADNTEESEEKFAKSGKKSKKHIEEVKAEEERQAR